MGKLSTLGNNLYTGKTSFPFVAKRKTWFAIALALVIGSLLVLVIKPPQFSIEFTGGSQFTIVAPATTDQQLASDAVQTAVPGATARVTVLGEKDVRIQTDQLTDDETRAVKQNLAEAFGVSVDDVSDTFIGPSWGQGVTNQSLWGLGVLLILTFIILAIYFRTWKMSAAAIVGLLDVLLITIGIYALFGFEISPAAVIGFLTIFAYSLYDMVVVFDKVRENTEAGGGRTFGESVNLAVNQTLVRSFNTSVVASLPVAAILFIGALWMGADTLTDISLAILIGIIVATYSTIFVSAPLYAHLRANEPEIKAADAKVLSAREAE